MGHNQKRRRTEVSVSGKWQPDAVGRQDFKLEIDIGSYRWRDRRRQCARPHGDRVRAYLLMARADVPVKSMAEMRRPDGPLLVLGSTAEGTTGSDVPMLLRETLGLNLKLVAGYPDNGAIFLAVDRGEVNGHTIALSTMRALRPDWVKADGPMRALVQFARSTRHPDFPDVPTARELAESEDARALIELGEIPYLMARPFVAPPGVPPDRAAALQAAFLAVHRDPQYLAEAVQLKLEVSPVGGAEVLRAIDRIAAAPGALLNRLRRMLAKS
jgi:tripartite-type tricarboxylate transporter receptor subunit TctC